MPSLYISLDSIVQGILENKNLLFIKSKNDFIS